MNYFDKNKKVPALLTFRLRFLKCDKVIYVHMSMKYKEFMRILAYSTLHLAKLTTKVIKYIKKPKVAY